MSSDDSGHAPHSDNDRDKGALWTATTIGLLVGVVLAAGVLLVGARLTDTRRAPVDTNVAGVDTERATSYGWTIFVIGAVGIITCGGLIGAVIDRRNVFGRGFGRGENRLRLAIQGTRQSYWEIDLTRRIGDFSLNARAMLGYAEDEISDRLADWEKLVHQDDLAQVNQAINDHLRQRTPYAEVRFRMRTRDGSWRWILSRMMAVERDRHGRALRLIGMNSDITAEQESALSQRQSQLVFDNVGEAILITDQNNRIISANQAFNRATGYTPDEYVGADARFLWFGRHDQAFLNAMRETLDRTGEWHGEIWNRRKSGEVYPAILSITAVRDESGRVSRHVAVFSNISEQKELADQLRGELAFRRSLLDAIPVPIFYKDRAGVYRGVNKAYEKFYGISEATFVGKTLHDVMAPHLAEIHDAKDRDLAENPGIQIYEAPLMNSVGQVRDAVFHKATYLDGDGRVAGLVCAILDITDRKRAIAAAHDSEARYRALFDQSPLAHYVVDTTTLEFVAVNESALTMHGFTREEFLALTLADIRPPADVPVLRDMLNNMGMQGIEGIGRHQRKDGTVFPTEFRARPFEIGGRLVLLVSVADISARVQSEQIFNYAREAILLTDSERRFVAVNPAFTRLTGYTIDEIKGQSIRLLRSDMHDDAFYTQIIADLDKIGYWHGEIWNRRKNGEIYPNLTTYAAIKDGSGNVVQYVGVQADITRLKQQEAELRTLAFVDPLTDLPNRRLLADRLNQAMLQCSRRKTTLAIAYIDIDGFKRINDMFGHEAGDRVLTTVAARMRGALREGDILARLGGDEFVAVLLDLGKPADALPVLERLLVEVRKAIELPAGPVTISASIGLTYYQPPREVEVDQLLAEADQAMYEAKKRGKNQIRAA